MKKRKIINFVILGFLVLSAIILFAFYKYNKLKQNTIDQRIRRYIENNCPDIEKCRVDISSLSNFNWDTFCTVDTGATLNQEPSIIPAPLPSKYSLNNPKIIFLQANKIVLFEEIPIGIETVPKGTVLFTINNGKYCYFDKKEAIFNVKRMDYGLGNIYFLYKP